MSKLILFGNSRILCLQNLRLSTCYLSRNFCDSKKSNSDEEDSPKAGATKTKPPNEELQSTTNRLNSLLKAMLDESSKKPKIELSLAQPTKKIAKKKKIEREEIKNENDNADIVKAAKKVAEHIGGDAVQTESELLSKLLSRHEPEASDAGTQGSLSDLIVGMKIDRSKKPSEGPTTHAQHMRKNMRGKDQRGDQRPQRKHRTRDATAKIGGRVELFSGDGLGIFKNIDELTNDKDLLSTTQELLKRELKLAIMHPPENYFQKMILWTEQGKLWRFPIDNEQGLKEEHDVYFAEHVFLDEHLEGWCPAKGPIRHFMELVCVGLSKNPYLTVQEKKNHIEWFRDYFKSKESLLEEVGALHGGSKPKTTNTTKSLTEG